MDQFLALRAFIRIAESGNFSKAGDLMNIPKPSVTRLIQELEAHLGVKLLQRTTRRVTLTAEGVAYYERAIQLIENLNEMDALAASAVSKPKGRLRVDIGSSHANFFLIPALPGFRSRYPDVQLDLGVSDRPMDLIGEGLDCVIRGGALPNSSLVTRRIASLEFVTCASPAYIRQYGRPDHPNDIKNGHVAIHYFSSLTGRYFPMCFHREDEAIEVALPTAISVNESTAHVTGLLAGLGLGQTFQYIAKPYIESGALIPLLTDWTRPAYDLNILYPSTRHVSARLRAFVDWTVEIFRPYSSAP
ncbi:LysR family transcriptional regulator [Rhizobium sp. P38BS-XIX]|uniref:LysR family transcriptional regulator n=1 Tax=Rhizobium sp. P38BS-XIX TaxID=2726740 RepID=UPI001456D583|nr:LysR family transcriptional regulator [Rhizobium sp. P38BS-XIX]NLS00746.1 LysR family transcriptional regulator [Rhizobium sp. P38BS-XIX]